MLELINQLQTFKLVLDKVVGKPNCTVEAVMNGNKIKIKIEAKRARTLIIYLE